MTLRSALPGHRLTQDIVMTVLLALCCAVGTVGAAPALPGDWNGFYHNGGSSTDIRHYPFRTRLPQELSGGSSSGVGSW